MENYIKIATLHLSEYYKGEEIKSIYFGGGTPSLLPTWAICELLNFFSSRFKLAEELEITLEANPKTIDLEKAKALKNAGINRLSLGIQSLNDDDLRTLGRIHSSKEALETLFLLINVFENVSIDMIYNRPRQTLNAWKTELLEVTKLPVQHLSLYELIVEDGTNIKKQIENGALPRPDSSDDFIKQTWKIVESEGFKRYEISNFARDQKYQSRHNMSYWKYEDYYGIGPGSHSRVSISSQKIAIAQISNNDDWLRWAVNYPKFETEVLSKDDEFVEILIMGLRASCGVNIKRINPNVLNQHDTLPRISRLVANGDALFDGDILSLTDQGLLRINRVVEYLTRTKTPQKL